MTEPICPHCSRPITSAASRCPSCGAEPPWAALTRRRRWALSASVAALAIVASAALGAYLARAGGRPLTVTLPQADQASPPADQAPASPPVPARPVRWGDWPRCQIRRTFVQLLRTQSVLISVRATETLVPTKPHSPPLETRAERAHWRLSWAQRLTRNARPPTAPSVEIVLHGLSAPFIQAFDFPLRPAA